MNLISIFFAFGLGMPEILVIVFALLLLFGGKKIPELMKGLGSGIREFNKAKKEVSDKLQEGMKEDKDSDSKSE